MVRFHRGSLLNPSAASLYRFNESFLQHFATDIRRRRLLQQIDCAPLGRRTQVHVALRRANVLVSGELLNRARRWA
jgi:hypothetical protein